MGGEALLSSYLYDRSVRGAKLITGPVVEPVSLDLAKQHLRLESSFTTDDTYVKTLIRAARAWAEQYTRQCFCKQTWKLTLDRFPTWGDTDDVYFWLFRRGIIDLAKPPLTAVTELAYIDTSGTRTVIDPSLYKLDIQAAYARLEPVYGEFWPITQFSIATVEITTTSGYTDGVKTPGGSTPPDNAPADGDPLNLIPDPIKLAMLLLVGAFYENREEVLVGQIPTRLPFGVEDLLSPYRFVRWP